MVNNTPTVSVIVLTYNQEKYISECLDSIYVQHCNFSFEIIIAEDSSTDSTPEICTDYYRKFSDRTILICREKNLGLVANYTDAIHHCNGEFIAVCGGDDYWTDTFKLQKQVDYLRKNPKCAFVHTDYDYYDVKKGCIIKDFQKSTGIVNKSGNCFDYTFNNTHIRALTLCFRKKYLLETIPILEETMKRNWVGEDLQVLLFLAFKYEIGYLSDSTGVYRRLHESISSSSSNIKMYDFKKSHLEIRLYLIEMFRLDSRTYEPVLRILFESVLNLAYNIHDSNGFDHYYQQAKLNEIKLPYNIRIFRQTISNKLYYIVKLGLRTIDFLIRKFILFRNK